VRHQPLQETQNSLHAAQQLLHRGVKQIFVHVAIFLSGLRAEKRHGALLLRETLPAGQACLAPLLRASFHPSMIKSYRKYFYS
jgi:hypothetical protein